MSNANRYALDDDPLTENALNIHKNHTHLQRDAITQCIYRDIYHSQLAHPRIL